MLTLLLSEKLLRLVEGEQMPASSLNDKIIKELINDGIILERLTGRTKKTLYITDAISLDNWLFNKFSINNLSHYIETIKNVNSSRAQLVAVSNNSKARTRRTYKGFLVNCFSPIKCTLNDETFVVFPKSGIFQFIYDYENFVPAPDVTIVGVENMENFRFIERQTHYFSQTNCLFVCRYPLHQLGDLINWLKSIPNQYLHFGDFDFAGINIYMNEFKKHIKDRATFFVPPNISELLTKYGNPTLYDKQILSSSKNIEGEIQKLINLIHAVKKGLEQEALLIEDSNVHNKEN
jgi:hypothetical protein